ncbi:MAG TPA: DUF5658 family protein [Vicinamibacterales bacterium]|nr:DUF5658 family protein [Vicinamibacterales bacterium]
MSRRLSVGAMVVALGCVPALARAQEGAAVAPVIVRPDAAPAKNTLLSSLYVSTAVMQGLDVQSTFSALNHGAVEANPMVTPIASHPAALLAVKSAVAATTIYAAHRVSKRNKAAAIGMLLAVNSAYAIIVAHNYRVSSGR